MPCSAQRAFLCQKVWWLSGTDEPVFYTVPSGSLELLQMQSLYLLQYIFSITKHVACFISVSVQQNNSCSHYRGTTVVTVICGIQYTALKLVLMPNFYILHCYLALFNITHTFHIAFHCFLINTCWTKPRTALLISQSKRTRHHHHLTYCSTAK